jgi:hypothetical protein
VTLIFKTITRILFYSIDLSSAIYCQIPPVPQNGIFSSVVNQVSRGEGLEVKCNQGYSIVGDAKINCQDDGAWDRPVPVCEKVKKIIFYVSEPLVTLIEMSRSNNFQ